MSSVCFRGTREGRLGGKPMIRRRPAHLPLHDRIIERLGGHLVLVLMYDVPGPVGTDYVDHNSMSLKNLNQGEHP